MEVISDDGSETLFSCPERGCGRRLVLKRSMELVVIDRGDFQARHVGANAAVQVSIQP